MTNEYHKTKLKLIELKQELFDLSQETQFKLTYLKFLETLAVAEKTELFGSKENGNSQ